MTLPRQRGVELTRESLANLFAFLGPDRNAAERKFEEIRGRLNRIFVCRGSVEPEELTWETIIRVADKSGDLLGSYVGDPALYFCGVARRVFLESVRKRPYVAPMPASDPWEDKERRARALDFCMSLLETEDRRLVLDYYRDEKKAKIERRKRLVKRLGLESTNALRIKMCRIRKKLRQCVTKCLEEDAAE